MEGHGDRTWCLVDWDLAEGPCGGSGGYRFEDVDGNTRFTFVADVDLAASFGCSGPFSLEWVEGRRFLGASPTWYVRLRGRA